MTPVRAHRFFPVLLLFVALLCLAACNGAGGPAGPALAAIADQRTTLLEPVVVQLAIASDDPASVTVSAESSDQTQVPNSSLSITGAGAVRTLTVTPTGVAPGTTTITVIATDAGGREAEREFELIVDRPFQDEPVFLTPSNADIIGASVAISDNFAVAGGLENAYLFELVGDDWVEVQKLLPETNSIVVAAGFGETVAVEGDVIVVGAPDTTFSAVGSGAAFVFEPSGGAWSEAAVLPDTAFPAGARFGASVGVNEGVVLVGAHGDTNGEDVATGTVTSYVPGGLGSWSLLGKSEPDGGVATDVFGHALDASGDLLVVGNYADVLRGNDAGAVNVFRFEGGFWDTGVELAPLELEASDQFGIDVAVDEEYLLVGAWNDDDQADDAGAVYVFHDDGGGWQQVDKLYASDSAENANFGARVALDFPYAVVGAYLEDSQGTNAGAVYVFRHDGASFREVAKLTSPNPEEFSAFGWGVDISGDHLIVSQIDSNVATFTVIYRR